MYSSETCNKCGVFIPDEANSLAAAQPSNLIISNGGRHVIHFVQLNVPLIVLERVVKYFPSIESSRRALYKRRIRNYERTSAINRHRANLRFTARCRFTMNFAHFARACSTLILQRSFTVEPAVISVQSFWVRTKSIIRREADKIC